MSLGKDNQQGQVYSYISYYRRIDPRWTLNTNCAVASDCDHNFKEYDYASGSGPYVMQVFSRVGTADGT